MIKKITLLILLFFMLLTPAFAKNKEFMPKYHGSLQNFGIGLYFGNGNVTIYSAPDEKSKVLTKLTWDENYVYENNKEIEPVEVFAVFVPRKGLSAFIAVDETENKYTQIIYDLKNGKIGWIKNNENEKAYYWRQLFYRYGKSTGLCFFKDIPKEARILRLAPDEFSEISYEFVHPKYVRLQLIKGNWALLKVVDYDEEQKVGWFQWRNPDGTLNMMPDFLN